MTQDEIKDFLNQADYVRSLLQESLVSQQYHEDTLLQAIDIIDELNAMYQCDLIEHRYTRYLEELRGETED